MLKSIFECYENTRLRQQCFAIFADYSEAFCESKFCKKEEKLVKVGSNISILLLHVFRMSSIDIKRRQSCFA
jgi:hypothetical protein